MFLTFIIYIVLNIKNEIIMRNKKDDVLCEIAKAAKIIEEKTDIKRDEFDKYPSEDLIKILVGMLTPS